MIARTLAILLASLCLVAIRPTDAAAISTDRARLHVEFLMSDAYYRIKFTNAELMELKDKAAEAIASVFGDKMPFLAFAIDDTAPYTLTIRLDRAEDSPSDLPAEFGFHITLEGPGIPADATGYLIFRPKDEFSKVLGSPDEFLVEIWKKLEAADHNALVDDVLRHVPIAEGAAFNASPPGWIIDRDRGTMCFDQESRLEVLSEFPSGPGRARHSFEAFVVVIDRPEIVSYADSSLGGVDKIMLDQLSAADPGAIDVERVSVLKYLRRCPPQPIPGDQVDFRNPGASP